MGSRDDRQPKHPCQISNLLSSPASGENVVVRAGAIGVAISNLLSSPASGELNWPTLVFISKKNFQFIEFPSEWGVTQLRHGSLPYRYDFQFIEFPSEWGVLTPAPEVELSHISNLLSSPASGEFFAPR